MKFARHTLLVLTIACAFGARLEAAPIFEPNNTKATATLLNAGTLSVTDSLNGNVGRPNTLLGHYNASYSTLLGSNDNGSPLGNGFASQMLGVPLDANGGAYFRITGAPDTNFVGKVNGLNAHTQSGQYYVQFDLYDSSGAFFKTLPLEFEKVDPGMVDNIWIDPPAVFEPQRVGGTVNVTIQNIVGPGTGDSLDFFWFSGLQPNQQFTATLTADFSARLGHFGGPNNTLQQSSGDATPTITAMADAQGRALLAVTGMGDTGFGGVHAEGGNYTLSVAPYLVPEPATITLAVAGLALLAAFRGKRRRR
jgi:hypothetical protein